MRSFLIGLVCLIVCLIVGCGGSSSSANNGSVNKLSIMPNPINLKPTEAVQLTAILDGGTAPITWSINSANGGSITQAGIYTAPVASGTYEVQVTLSSDPGKFGKANAVVNSGYIVSISTANSPSGPFFVSYNGTLQMIGKVAGSSSNDVTWTTTLGTISPTGLLTAPAGPGTAMVKATSVTDPGKSVTVPVEVVPAVEIVNSGLTRLAIPSSRHSFLAKVNGSVSSNVDWSASTGSISQLGIWTANSTFTGIATITATSKTDNSKFASTTVTVAPNLNVRFSFMNKGDVLLQLRPDKAPNTCANLVSLVNEKFYDGILIHRYEAGTLVQWGDPLTKTKPLTDLSIGTGGPGYTIDFEPNDLLHLKYSLGMARQAGLNTAGSQIYVCLSDQPSFDGNYVVFGSVSGTLLAVEALRRADKITTATVELP